ncbi:MAG: alpha/beta hydrolase [Pseudomonadota bacterium]
MARSKWISIPLKILRWAGIALLALLITGLSYERFAARQAARQFPPPGRMISVGEHRLHIDCRGTGSPMLLLESGAQLWSSGWRHIHNDLRSDYRVCAYDRSGLGWSNPGAGPYDAEQAVQELNALLNGAQEERPFIYVGHSLGGMLARVYHRQFPEEIAAAVYIDSGEPELVISDFEAARDDPPRPCGFLCKSQVAAAYLGVPRIVLSQLDLLDDASYPPDAVAEFRALAPHPQALRSALLIARNLPKAAFQTLDAGHINNRPVLVLYSGNYGEMVSDGEPEEEMQRWRNAYFSRWRHAVEVSPGGVGPIEIPGSNHLTVIVSQPHAIAVADEIRKFVTGLQDR